MRTLNPLYFLFLAVPLILAGCVEYDQEMIINKDGSGTVKVHYNAAAQEPIEEGAWLRSWARNVPELPFSEEEIIDSYGGAPLDVEEVSIATIDGNPDASYRVSFDNVEDLNGRGIFSLEGGTLSQTFSLQEEDGTCTFEQTVDFYWPVEIDDEYKSYLSEYVFTYQVKVPGEIGYSNGTPGPNNTVKWEYTLAELWNAQTTLWVTYDVPETFPIFGSTKKIGTAVGWLVGIFILCAFIAIPILLVLLKRDKLLFMNAVIKGLEKGLVLKKVVAVVLIIFAVAILLSGAVLYLYMWSEAVEMVGLWQAAGFAYAVILGIIIYMMAHATIMRAKNVLELPESESIIIPVASKILRLTGEVLACGLVAAAILRAGVGLLLLSAAETAPSSLSFDKPSDCILTAVLLAVSGFASLIASYVVAESLAVLVDVAKKVKSSKKADGAG
jgi:hypothetical protein